MNGILRVVTGRASIVVALAVPALYGATWIRVATPHFEIYTDRNEQTARRVLSRFEGAHRVLASGAWGRESDFPIRVLLFSSERDYGVLEPVPGVPGFFQSGPDRDTIAMLAGAELDRIILHEYTHSVLNHTSAPLPQWLEEGLAEFYSTLEVDDARAREGAPIRQHVAALARGKWLSAAELAAVNHQSPEYNERDKTGIFYAESWALTHMLMLGEPYRGRLAQFVHGLTAGETEQAAFVRAFGRPMDAALSDVPAYLRTGVRTIAVEVAPSSDIVFSEPTRLDPATVEQARAEVLLLERRDRDAQVIYEAVARRYPNLPAAQTGLAVIAMREGDHERARKCFERAIELGGRDGETYFEYAMLLRDTGAPVEQVEEFLRRTITANPSHAEAHFLLGIRATDAGRYSDAVEHLQRAAQILPRQAYFWQALAYAQYKLGHTAEARTAASRALRAAKTGHETDMARQVLNLIEERPAQAIPRAGVITPDSWRAPKGDRSVTGDLVEVDCEGTSARLHIRTGAGIEIVEVKNPKAVTIRGGGGERALACGPQTPVTVVVEYVGTTRQVTALEFRKRD